jgi:hypothetical protein
MSESFSTHTQEPEIIIESGRTEKNYWADLWRYRELFLILAWRDISVRYKQTIIGILWAIIRPSFSAESPNFRAREARLTP